MRLFNVAKIFQVINVFTLCLILFQPERALDARKLDVFWSVLSLSMYFERATVSYSVTINFAVFAALSRNRFKMELAIT